MKNSPFSLVYPSLVAAALVAAASSGCAGPQRMTPSDRLTGADGEVTTRSGDNGNTAVTVKVRHLAPPARFKPGTSTYVVWVQRDSSTPPQNIGALKVDQSEEGTLTSMTPFSHFNLFVTAEADGTAAQPSPERALWSTSM